MPLTPDYRTALVDSHCHVAPNWYEPVDVLLAQMDRAGVAQAVLVQLLGCYDNRYLLDCAKRYPQRFAVVVAVDVAGSDAAQQLARARDAGAAGVRLRPTARSPGTDPLALWRSAEALGMPVSCVGNPSSFASMEFQQVLDSLPGLRVVLEHLGGSSAADTSEELRAARARSLLLARYPQVTIKLPGLGEFEPRASALNSEQIPVDFESARRVLAEVLKSFGPERLMWGSDFPVVSSREGYGNALGWCRELVNELAGPAGATIFGATARTLFRLP
jgi:L-fuconolactonase